MADSFGTRTTLESGGRSLEYRSLPKLTETHASVASLPFSLRVLLENLLRLEDGVAVTKSDIEAIAGWDPTATPSAEIAYTPARVLLQDFTGVPAVVDLAAMRDAMAEMGGDPSKINPLRPVDLVIDHSVQVDVARSHLALEKNIELEYERNGERYAFLRWGQGAFRNFTAVPPGAGIVHQINIEYLSQVAFVEAGAGENGADLIYPDTLVGTDSHTTMANGLGVLGWGVGGIEAEAAMLGQPVSMLIPQVVGFELTGKLPEGSTATDLVLRVTEMLRELGVVGRFVEFFGSGLDNLPLADRATIGNMSPEFGSTCAIFPVDEETLRYLQLTGRSAEQIQLVRDYYTAQGMFRTADSVPARYTETLTLDLDSVEPAVAGPRRPQDRIALKSIKSTFATELASLKPGASGTRPALAPAAQAEQSGGTATLTKPEVTDGSVVIAAITSCTNTSNPSVMVASGLLARKARERGLTSAPWVKPSLAPGSKVVTEYLENAGLDKDLEAVGFYTVGYGFTTSIGNSGPLPEDVLEQVQADDLVVASVLSGNRNFEGRINNDVKMNFLMSPPLVVAYAIAGHMDWDPATEPLGIGSDGEDVFLSDIWPTTEEIKDTVDACVQGSMFTKSYSSVYEGDDRWRALPTPAGDRFAWDDKSTYIRRPSYFDGLPRVPAEPTDILGARCLVKVGDSVTTDHISPAGGFRPETPAGKYLLERGVAQRAFNSYGSRRGNHEIMMRGTFANVRLRNQLAPGTEGGFTQFMPGHEETTIFEASQRYVAEGTPLVLIAGKEYGSGSSRDWAAKGPNLLGVRAAIAESYERIHRSNLVGMGILPLQFLDGDNADKLGLTGYETFEISGIADMFTSEAETTGLAGDRTITVTAKGEDGMRRQFRALVRVDTPKEVSYYRHGGILQYVLRNLLHGA
ncbi:MAG: aconitate hydratase 1 [Thermoleophilia bacterium]|nr:aconitate hydratase 1 [Thermoleophilia bacterium]